MVVQENNMQELTNGYYWARHKGEIGEEFIIEVFKDEWWKTGVEHNCKDNDIEILERVEYAR